MYRRKTFVCNPMITCNTLILLSTSISMKTNTNLSTQIVIVLEIFLYFGHFQPFQECCTNLRFVAPNEFEPIHCATLIQSVKDIIQRWERIHAGQNRLTGHEFTKNEENLGASCVNIEILWWFIQIAFKLEFFGSNGTKWCPWPWGMMVSTSSCL